MSLLLAYIFIGLWVISMALFIYSLVKVMNLKSYLNENYPAIRNDMLIPRDYILPAGRLRSAFYGMIGMLGSLGSRASVYTFISAFLDRNAVIDTNDSKAISMMNSLTTSLSFLIRIGIIMFFCWLGALLLV